MEEIKSCDFFNIAIALSDNWFIPSSVLADWRRQLCESLIEASLVPHLSPFTSHPSIPHQRRRRS